MESIAKHINRDGIINTSDIVNVGISKFDFYRFIKNNNFEKVAPGMYAQRNTLLDELIIIRKRCPQGVLSHEEALYYYGLIDHEPIKPSFTIYSGYNVSRLNNNGYKIYYVKKDLLGLGKTNVIDAFGNNVSMYDLERTICDLVRNRRDFEIQDFNTALKSYVRRKDKNITKLLEYAKKFKVENILRKYLEILL